jgi:hypothetical protein
MRIVGVHSRETVASCRRKRAGNVPLGCRLQLHRLRQSNLGARMDTTIRAAAAAALCIAVGLTGAAHGAGIT